MAAINSTLVKANMMNINIDNNPPLKDTQSKSHSEQLSLAAFQELFNIKGSPDNTDTNKNKRFYLDDLNLLHWSQERIQSCIDQLEIEKYQTATEAKKVADDWYDTLQNKEENSRRCFAKIRIKLSGNSLEAQWRYVTIKNSKIYIHAISKPKGSYSYSIKTFRGLL